jgi:F-type H+-transporting ATPase subunit b
MHIDWWTLALQTINFLILVWLLQRFLYRPVLAAIGKRREEIQGQVAAADREKAAAEEQRRQLDAARAGLVQERDQVLTEARTQAAHEAEQILAAAQAEAKKVVDAGQLQLEAAGQAAAGRLRAQASRLGIAVAQRLLAVTAPADPTIAFLDRALAAINRLPAHERAQLDQQLHSDGLVLATAAAIPPATESACRQRLEPVFGPNLQLRFVTDASLLAGVELRLANMTVGDNWRDHLAAALAELTADESGYHA